MRKPKNQKPSPKTNQTKPEKSSKFWQKDWVKQLATILLILVGLYLLSRTEINWLVKIRQWIKFLFDLFFFSVLGLLAGGILYHLLARKGVIIIDNTPQFLKFCAESNGLVFWGPFGQGKTALMALLAQELPGDNKYASFPCQLPWMERAQIDFTHHPSQPLGIKSTIFLDEINLLFKGNEFQKNRQKEKFMAHFYALSRHQGTQIFINGQRLGQIWIELREVATAVCQIQLIAKTDEGIYVKVEIWSATAWSQEKTETEFTVFVPKLILDTYNSEWLKGLKHIRKNQGYI